MLLGVWYGWGINAYVIVAMIGLSVVYKRWFWVQPDTKAATLIFGLFHGTGLATTILEYQIAEDGLLADLIAFDVIMIGAGADSRTSGGRRPWRMW